MMKPLLHSFTAAPRPALLHQSFEPEHACQLGSRKAGDEELTDHSKRTKILAPTACRDSEHACASAYALGQSKALLL
jgi:hypothetical protein